MHGFFAASPPRPAPIAPDGVALAPLCRQDRPDALVAIGPEAAQAAAQECPVPLLVVRVSRQQVAPWLAEGNPGSRSAIYLEAKPSLNLRLVRALLPAARTVGVLVPTPAPGWLAPLRTEAHRWDFTLDEIPVTDDLGAVRALRPRLPGLDAVLLPPETTVINEWSLKPLLLMTIRQGVPTFGGLTARYVDAGVLAAVVADEERLPEQMQTVVAELARGRAPAPVYPAAVRVAVNPTVAQTLGVPAEAVARARALFFETVSMRPFSRGPCRLSIHRQILAIALAPALIVTGLLLFVVYQGNLEHNRRLLDQHGQVLAAQLAGALEYSLATGALEQLPAIIDATVQPATAILGTPVRGVIVTDAAGRVLYRQPAADPAPPAPEALAELVFIPAEEDRVRFAAPVLLRPLALSAAPSPPRPLGEVAVELSVAIAQARWHRGLAWDLGLVLLTFAGAAGLAHWTGRRLSGAIRRIATAIERIKRGDFAVRVRPTDRNELGTLQDGVNLLAETLARGKARLDLELAKVRAEYQQALDDLQVQTRAAERANAAKSLFLAKVSHEMRTPLYSIQGLVESRLKTLADEAETATLRTILAAAHTLYRHISDILDYTQLEQGKYAPALTPLVVWDEVEAIVAPLEPLLAPRGLYLDVVVAPDVPRAVASDAKAFRAILTNLLGNAVKFTEAGGIALALEVAAPALRPSPTRLPVLRVRVTNTGCGIATDQLVRIFAPFEQVDEALNRRYAGIGLGLSIVKGYCELLGGRVVVSSTLGGGSTFTVELPLLPATEPTSGRPRRRTCFRRAAALVADERASFRASVAARLAGLGIAVEAQAVPWRALVAAPAPENPYDLLVVQNLAAPPDAVGGGAIAGLRGWARCWSRSKRAPTPR